MPRERSGTEVWESRRAADTRLACRRLLVSVPLFVLSVGIRQTVDVSGALVFWMTWFAAAALAIAACGLACEAICKTRASGKTHDKPSISSAATAVMWLTIFWIVCLALEAFLRIATI